MTSSSYVSVPLALPPSGRIASKLFVLQFLRVAEFMPQIAGLLNHKYKPSQSLHHMCRDFDIPFHTDG